MKSINKKLALATCTLLTQQNANAILAIDNAWDVDASYLYYGEDDGRITVSKFVANVSGDVTDRDRVKIQEVLDSITGATPTGAIRSDTVAGASVILANIRDTRTGVSINWAHDHANNWTLDYSASFSIENDYHSYGGGLALSKATAKKDYTFTLGVAATYDTIFQTGTEQTPKPLTKIDDQIFLGEGERSTIDLNFSITRIINRRTIGKIGIGYSQLDGYLSDPYKLFTIIDSSTGKPLDTDASVFTEANYTESRPTTRARTFLTLSLNHQTYPKNHIIHASYRFYTDDWEVNSHTLDLGYRIPFGTASSVEPRIRLYQQTHAFFYRNQVFVPDASSPINLPKFISADYRLDDMSSITAGLQFSTDVGKMAKVRSRLEYMYQTFDTSQFDTNAAIIFQIAFIKSF